ncbi:hypothetical protein [Salsuginibacillus kocurii]|uniref:hypothetical protein n=1 Tax=Salsuginibacillus kocurii TaxID=427078 RepID=UPI0003781AC1|nr:hypothetical protein [Salsuginibacillus kocurii]
MDEKTKETIKIADQWVNYSNQSDIDGLSKVTSTPLELIGPKGAGKINLDELNEWLKRAKLTLETVNRYAKNNFIVLEQRGTWLHEDNTVKGKGVVFTVFKVVDSRVCFLARYDDLESAFNSSGLSEGDKVG